MSRYVRIGILAVAACLIAVVAAERPHLLPKKTPYPVIELHKTAKASYTKPPSKRYLFVLVIGSDVRQGNPRAGRSDSLHLVGVDTKTGAGTIVGIPRDSYVPIPGHGTNKINSSLFFGGPEATVETVSHLTGIQIQYWALIDFSRFRRLVDDLGGVKINVPYPMFDHFSGAHFNSGPKHMNGENALAFARDRHTVPNGDFGRSENQGRMLIAALKKFRADTGDPLKLAAYLRAFHDLVATNVDIGELLDLAAIGRKIDPSKMKNIVVPGRGGSAGGASVVFLSPGDLFSRFGDDAKL